MYGLVRQQNGETLDRSFPTYMRPLAIELTFDRESELRLQNTWTELSELYPAPQSWGLGSRPHITLLLFRDEEPDDLQPVVQALVAELEPFPIVLSSVDHFSSSEGVVFLRPDPSNELVRAHAAARRLLGSSASGVDQYYRPGTWQPHCTVAGGVPPSSLQRVLLACRASEALGAVHVEGLQLVRYRPVEELWAADIPGPQGQDL